METIENATTTDTILNNDVISSPENVNIEVQSMDIALDNQVFTLQPMLMASAPVASLKFTDGDILISLLLSILIILNIFGGVNNVIFGVKIKKQKYD